MRTALSVSTYVYVLWYYTHKTVGRVDCVYDWRCVYMPEFLFVEEEEEKNWNTISFDDIANECEIGGQNKHMQRIEQATQRTYEYAFDVIQRQRLKSCKII